ncbi:MAG: transglycosylase domain-containing protein, partial [Christensenellales bacterium]
MKKFVKISLISLSAILLLIGVVFGGFFAYINTSQRDVQFNKELLQEANATIDIYDINNEKINDEIGKKALVKYEELPNYVKNAFVSIEDKDFYKHNSLNYKR